MRVGAPLVSINGCFLFYRDTSSCFGVACEIHATFSYEFQYGNVIYSFVFNLNQVH